MPRRWEKSKPAAASVAVDREAAAIDEASLVPAPVDLPPAATATSAPASFGAAPAALSPSGSPHAALGAAAPAPAAAAAAVLTPSGYSTLSKTPTPQRFVSDANITQGQLLSGYRVALRDKRQGEVEFVATSGEALVSLDNGRARTRPWLEETQRTWVEGLWPEQCWQPANELRVTERQHRLRERRDVADFRHALRCLEGRQQGLSAHQLAMELGRPEAWVSQALQGGAPSKPKHLEHWNAQGFCEVRYVKGLYHKEGLYESIVQGVDWQQDRVWRVHKEADGQWDLRTVKECRSPGCGRTLQRVPETAVKIGPRDSAGPSRTKPHSNWRCEMQGAACIKVDFGTPLGDAFYWWCPTHKWYVCQECHKDIEDKPTSKQIRGWYCTECEDLDDLVYRVVRDFNLPDPQAAPGGTARYTIKMNWYPDGLAQVTDHRHDVWTILVSLGAPRVLNVDHARVLMEDGDAILFGTQKHGVPPGPPTQGGRLSLVLMFHPDPQVEAAALHLAGRTPLGFVPRPLGEPPAGFGAEAAADAEQVATLCAALGVSEAEAARALEMSGNDAEVAAEILLGAD